MLRIAVLVSGGGTNLQAIIDGIAAGTITNTQIAAVISNKKDAFALERARRAGIPGIYMSPREYDTKEAFTKALLAQLEELDVGLIVLAGCLMLIPPEVVERYRYQIINIHPSLIPSFCGKGFYGLKVHEEALKRGVKVTGATCHFVDEGTDTGPIIYQKAVEVEPDDTPEILQRRVMEQAEWIIMPKAIDDIANHRLQVIEGTVHYK